MTYAQALRTYPGREPSAVRGGFDPGRFVRDHPGAVLLAPAALATAALAAEFGSAALAGYAAIEAAEIGETVVAGLV